MKTICIDPGHGGRDPGAVGPSGLQEKDVNLAIAQEVIKLLNGSVSTILSTRGGDADISLQERANFANKNNADVFVSVHCNAATNPAVHGLEAFYFPESGAGKRLAEAILDRLVLETGLDNRGVKAARFAVLRLTDMPAALVECGFLSNPTEKALLETVEFQKKCARGIADGIKAFLGIEKAGLDNILSWTKNSVEKAVSIGLVANPELLTESEQKVLVWFDRLGMLK